MDVDQSSQNDGMDGGGESKLKKGVLEDSGVTNQSMDVPSPAVQNRPSSAMGDIIESTSKTINTNSHDNSNSANKKQNHQANFQTKLSKNKHGVSSKNNHTSNPAKNSAQNSVQNSDQNLTNPTQNVGQALNNQSQQQQQQKQQQNSPNDTLGIPAHYNPAAIILPDCCKPNIDILIVGINPGYHSAITKHHYAGPTNHFWKCLHISGLVTELLSSEKDHRLPAEFGIGLTNLCTRVTTSSSELTGAELRAGKY